MNYTSFSDSYKDEFFRLHEMGMAMLNVRMNDVKEYDPRQVGARILTVREAHGLSQSKLAGKCGFSVTALSGWENGRVRPSIAFASEICDVFGLTLDYLLRGKTETLKHATFLHLQQAERS